MMVAGIALVVLYIPMSVGVYRLLERSTTAWYGTTAVVFGLAVLLPAYLVNLLPPLAFVPLAGELGTIGGEVLYADYSVARIAAELFFTVGSVLSLAVGPSSGVSPGCAPLARADGLDGLRSSLA